MAWHVHGLSPEQYSRCVQAVGNPMSDLESYALICRSRFGAFWPLLIFVMGHPNGFVVAFLLEHHFSFWRWNRNVNEMQFLAKLPQWNYGTRGKSEKQQQIEANLWNIQQKKIPAKYATRRIFQVTTPYVGEASPLPLPTPRSLQVFSVASCVPHHGTELAQFRPI